MRSAIFPHLLDLLSLFASMAMFTAYNAFVWWKLKRDPIYTIQGAMRLARKSWVVSIMEDRRDILAVQTLRNSTMAATFLASTAILLSAGVLGLAGQGERLGDLWHSVNIFGSTEHSTLVLKLLVLLVNLFIAFFSFSTSIRLYNHVGFMINVPCSDRDYSTSFTFVALQLDRAAGYFHLGMRAFYFLVPLVFWLFGPLFMLAATLAVIGVVFYIDKTPRMDYDKLCSMGDQDACRM